MPAASYASYFLCYDVMTNACCFLRIVLYVMMSWRMPAASYASYFMLWCHDECLLLPTHGTLCYDVMTNDCSCLRIVIIINGRTMWCRTWTVRSVILYQTVNQISQQLEPLVIVTILGMLLGPSRGRSLVSTNTDTDTLYSWTQAQYILHEWIRISIHFYETFWDYYSLVHNF